LELKKYYNITIGAAHINHSLRGEASDGDEKFVKELCENLGVEVYTKKVDIKAYAAKGSIGEEEAGRKIRYSFFEEKAKDGGYNKIATAHNLDDNVETFLFRLMRGTGIEGLCGIPLRRDNIIRPLLTQKKSEILKYLEGRKITYRIDESNNETDYTRNKIRLKLIPYIEKEFNNNFVDCLYPLIEEIDGINSHIKKFIEKELEEEILYKRRILKYDVGIRKKIFKSFIERYPVEVNRRKVEAIEDIFYSDGYKEVDLGQGYIFVKEYDKMYIKKENNEIYDKNKIPLEINEKIMYNGYVIESKLVENIPRKKGSYYFDYDKMNKGIFVRTREEGDRFVPFGMKKSKKLKNFFIDEKVERLKRDIMPILVSGEDIILVGNLRSTDLYRVDKNTKKILLLKVEEVEADGK
jgi:tRNA(Ile)-lysidine synthase